jgi:polyhydroxyalkanoate synthesis regulator protein
MANSDRPTIIEKYANRRLYNTGTFTFVTLDDLAAMVKRGKNMSAQTAVLPKGAGTQDPPRHP